MKRFVISYLIGMVLGTLLFKLVHAGEPIATLKAATGHVFIAGNGLGSGGIIQSSTTGKKYLITNWHVCRHAGKGTVEAEMENGERVSGKVIYADPTHDLCLVKVNQRRFAIPIGSSLKIGDKLWSHGYPRGHFIETTGILKHLEKTNLDVADSVNGQCPKAFKKQYNAMHLLIACTYDYPSGITTLYSAPGSSGSPIVNENGELVGVMQSATWEKNDGGMIMLDRIQEFMRGY